MRIPTTASWSVTTTDPIWRRSIRAVASPRVVSAAQVTGGDDISSSTAVGIGGSFWGGDRCGRVPQRGVGWSRSSVLPPAGRL